MKQSSSVKFWSLSVQIGGGRGHRRHVVVLDTLINAFLPNKKKAGPIKSGCLETMVVS